MELQCIACNQSTENNQPYYCQECFIPVSPYHEEKYIGHTDAKCPNCEETITNRSKCEHCGENLSMDNPPIPAEISKEIRIRQKNREKLAEEVLDDSRMTQQVIETLGIEHLPREEQGVALTALAKEKMNFLSSEYNFGEAHTLVDMGFAIVNEVGKQWAIQIATSRLASYHIRAGMPMQAAQLLHDQYKHAPEGNEIEKLRKLEVLAKMALSHRLAGNATIATEIAEQAHEELLALYQDMETDIERIKQHETRQSQFMGSDEEGLDYPRVDYIFMISVILTEETIARGVTPPLKVTDLAIDRMLELDNLARVLGRITPTDDSGYFASHLRDYIRLSNGLLWYGDTLIPNTGTKRRLLIERYFERINQWRNIIPPHFWLPLRPARFLEIFMRAESWSDKIDAETLANEIFSQSKDEHKPSWHYVIADAKAKVGKYEESVDHLETILDDKEDYVKYADEQLRDIANNLLSSVQLESMGILLGVRDTEISEFDIPINIQLEDPRSHIEPETYLQDEMKGPVLRMIFDSHEQILDQNIGVFGDRLLEIFDNPYPAIVQVGDKPYDDESWNTPADPDVEGVRMDIVVLRIEIDEEEAQILLFEAKPQEIEEQDGKKILHPSPLLILRGIIHRGEIDLNQFLGLLADLMSEEQEILQRTEMFVLKNNGSSSE